MRIDIFPNRPVGKVERSCSDQIVWPRVVLHIELSFVYVGSCTRSACSLLLLKLWANPNLVSEIRMVNQSVVISVDLATCVCADFEMPIQTTLL